MASCILCRTFPEIVKEKPELTKHIDLFQLIFQVLSTVSVVCNTDINLCLRAAQLKAPV